MLENKLKRRFNVLSIIISKCCNGKCDYCLITRNHDKDKHQILPFSNIKKIIEIIQSFDLSDVQLPYKIAVQIVGGEPLIFPTFLIYMMDTMITSCPKIDFIFNIYTNGCAVTPELLEKLSYYPITINFSIDEVTQIDTHRFYHNRPMNVVTKEKLLLANSLYPNLVRTNTVISELTYKGLYDVYEFHKKNHIWKWGWGFMRCPTPEEAEWKPENFQEMEKIIRNITKSAQQYPFILYNILEYGQVKGCDMTSENIPLYINMDETISTLSGDHCFRIPIQDFSWDIWFKTILQNPKLYMLDLKDDFNLTECIHCHYREKHLAGQLHLPLSQCRWSMLLRDLYNQYYRNQN